MGVPKKIHALEMFLSFLFLLDTLFLIHLLAAFS